MNELDSRTFILIMSKYFRGTKGRWFSLALIVIYLIQSKIVGNAKRSTVFFSYHFKASALI